MYSKDMLTGIFLCGSKIDFHIEKNETSNIGYSIRLRVNLRAEEEFLLGVQRSLLQFDIKSTFKEQENKARPKPILRIGGIKNLYLLTEMVDDLPDAKGEWIRFREAVDIVSNKEHLTLEGMERMLKLKGVL